jgi:chitosanase
VKISGRLVGLATAMALVASVPLALHYGASATTAPIKAAAVDLTDPHKKDIALQIVSSAENSSLDWKAQYKYIEDINDGRGYTAGIIGFCSGTGDMLDLVALYSKRKPGNVLEKYLPALRKVDGTPSHAGLDPGFTKDWKAAANDPAFKKAQDDERDRVYFNPSVSQAKKDGLRALGQFIYYDAIVMHGNGGDRDSFGSIRANALKKARPPAQGGDEAAYRPSRSGRAGSRDCQPCRSGKCAFWMTPCTPTVRSTTWDTSKSAAADR